MNKMNALTILFSLFTVFNGMAADVLTPLKSFKAALASDDLIVRRIGFRSIRDASPVEKDCEELVSGVKRDLTPFDYCPYLRAMQKACGQAEDIERVARAIKSGDTDAMPLLCFLGGLQSEKMRAASAIKGVLPYLRSDEDRVVAQIALAALEMRHSEGVRHLRQNEKCTSAILMALSLIHDENWASDELVAILKQILEKSNEESMFAALLAGQLAGRAAPCLRTIDQMIGKMEREKDGREIVAFMRFVKFRIEYPVGNISKDVVMAFSSREFDAGRTALGLNLLVSDFFLNERDIGELKQMLSNERHDVRLGAIRLLCFAEAKDEAVIAEIVKIAESDKEERCRVAAIMALGLYQSSESRQCLIGLLKTDLGVQLRSVAERALAITNTQ